jgi:transposase
MYLLSTGCQWRYLPKDFPPQGAVRGYFDAWSWRGGLERMHDVLCEFCRAQEGREASPTAAIIDSQSVKGSEKGGSRSIRTGSTQARKSRAKNDISS